MKPQQRIQITSLVKFTPTMDDVSFKPSALAIIEWARVHHRQMFAAAEAIDKELDDRWFPRYQSSCGSIIAWYDAHVKGDEPPYSVGVFHRFLIDFVRVYNRAKE
jgi:hypothetical protein